uniref:Uncharacterized protein n=1 Tax=Nothobranchius furzeri TaxID=105023 RepID=A0A1A8UA17_NOTFU
MRRCQISWRVHSCVTTAGWIRPCTAPIHAATDTEESKDELHPKIFFHLLFLKCHQ